MKRSNKDSYHQRQEYVEHEENPIVSTSYINLLKILKHLQSKLKVPCALFSIIFILWLIQLMWNNLHFNTIAKYGLYVKSKDVFPNNTLATRGRRTAMQSCLNQASWDLLGSSKSSSLYTKFSIDGKAYNLEVDTGSFLTWFRCNIEVYQGKVISHMDPNCKKVAGKHFVALNEDLCSYHVVYEDNSHSIGVIVKSNIQIKITNMITGVTAIYIDETLLGCSYRDFNPIREYKDAIDGLLGLARSTHGIQVSLLKHGIPLYFGICFKDFLNKKEETKVGYLYFGNHHSLDYSTHIKWIDFPEDYIFGDESYELRISNLWIEDDINIPINANMMMDTGTPLTFVEASLFETLIYYINERALEAGYAIYEEPLKHFKCWNFPEPLDESFDMMEMLSFDFPNLKLQFSNGNKFIISPTKYLASYAFIQDGICANMRSFNTIVEYPKNVMILGARMMAEYHLVFDNEKDRFGFMPLPNCYYN